MRQVLIVHYNTPELTEAAILSLRKHGGEHYHVNVFDNSDRRPFKADLPGVDVFDNTKGQYIDLDKELENYPDRSNDMGICFGGNFGSARHMMSVQWVMDNLLTDDFLLMDSDILIKSSPDLLWLPEYCAAGFVQNGHRAGNRFDIDRLLPMLLYINAKKCRETGVRFFDHERCYALQRGGKENRNNWYDTGAAMLEDIKNNIGKGARGLKFSYDIYVSLFDHYAAASWLKKNNVSEHLKWLERRKKLWQPNETYVIPTPVLPKGWGAKSGLKIFICAHGWFLPQVQHPAYEIVYATSFDNDTAPNGLKGLFYSEFLTYYHLANRKSLPKWVGFCQWRKYWQWMSNVPKIDHPIVSKSMDLRMSVRDHFGSFANMKDLDLCTDIVNELYPEFAPAWERALDSSIFHPYSMCIIPSKDFRRMMRLIWSVLEEWVKRAGDIDARLDADPQGYHLGRFPRDYAYRIGGQLGERLVSAWMDWQFPEAEEVAVRITGRHRW